MSGVQRVLEVGLILCGAFALFLMLALGSFSPADPSWSQTSYEGTIENAAGAIGAWFADALLFAFGYVSYFVPIGFAALGYLLFRQPHRLLELDYLALGLRLIGLLLTFIGASALASMNFMNVYSFSAGGIVGDVISSSLLPYFNIIGTTLLLLTFLLTGLTLVSGLSWVKLIDGIGAIAIRIGIVVAQQLRGLVKLLRSYFAKSKETSTDPTPSKNTPARGRTERAEPELSIPEMNALDDDEPLFALDALDADGGKGKAPAPAPSRFSREARQAKAAAAIAGNSAPVQDTPIDSADDEDDSPVTLSVDPLPSIELLDRPNKTHNPLTQEELDQIGNTVEAVLLDFGVEVKVANVQPGPVITRFELDLAPGVKVSKISNLDKDIARSLSAISVRVVEVIPGKSYVGLELPNKSRETVYFSEVVSCDAFQQSTSPLTMVLGKGIAGQPVIVDLAKMPHLLVAGTTGSGKSVGVNVMILSLLYKSSPEDVRLIMIDPKMLELSVYEGIPHLLTEVVTDMKDAANALRWCVGEMERRYKLMSALGVRNLKGYNAKVVEAREAGEPLLDPIWKPGDSMDPLPPELEKLPSIVVVIDEFADMMMIVGKKVEELIARIAQKARAAGIHLILATQRPSVDVITGLIKANIPTRIAFQVQSKIDSRTILDQPGADQLLGAGDMLYLPPGSGVPTRVHGAFVDDHEVHAVVADWKKRGRPNYLEEILKGDMGEDTLLPGEQLDMGDEESDTLYDEAVAFVTETRRVSISSVQRKFRIGYNRAARIVEQMEMSGVVTSAGHNGQREVLAPKPPRD